MCGGIWWDDRPLETPSSFQSISSSEISCGGDDINVKQEMRTATLFLFFSPLYFQVLLTKIKFVIQLEITQRSSHFYLFRNICQVAQFDLGFEFITRKMLFAQVCCSPLKINCYQCHFLSTGLYLVLSTAS